MIGKSVEVCMLNSGDAFRLKDYNYLKCRDGKVRCILTGKETDLPEEQLVTLTDIGKEVLLKDIDYPCTILLNGKINFCDLRGRLLCQDDLETGLLDCKVLVTDINFNQAPRYLKF